MEMRRRYRSIDIIKGIAMIMVILVHYAQNFHFAFTKVFYFFQMGCPIFFVASGFGIMCLIKNNFGGSLEKKKIWLFYFSRIKTLAPGWYVAFFVVFFINSLVIYFTGNTLTFGTNRNWLSILCNLLFINGLLPFCNNNVMPGGWYVGDIVIFYTLTPLIIYFNKKANKYFLFIISSTLGMIIWIILYFSFRNVFNNENFGYFIFLVHYPEYFLGIILFENFNKNLIEEKKIKLYFPFGIISLVISIVLFYAPIHFSSIPSAWMTALATYFVLYYMLYYEQKVKPSWIGNILVKYGKNSYYIFLLHCFFVWSFMIILLKLFDKFKIPEIITFIMLFPIILFISYAFGLIFNILVKKYILNYIKSVKKY